MEFRNPRWPTDGLVHVVADGADHMCALRNVSQTGISCEGLLNARRGQSVRIMVAGRPLRADIKWALDRVFGAVFEAPLSVDDLAKLRKLPRSKLMRHATARPVKHSHGFREL